MSREHRLTVDQLAEVLRVPVDMVRQWRQQGILPPAADDGHEAAMYDRREVVAALRNHPKIMAEIKSAMRRGDQQ